MTTRHEHRLGLLSGASAHVLWGVLPVFWKLFEEVPVGALLAHRVLWSFPSLLVLVLFSGGISALAGAMQSPKEVLRGLVAGSFLALNWMCFLYCVSTEQVLQAALGYFINPIVAIVLGVLVLHESLNRFAKVAVAFALLGVLLFSLFTGGVPWVSLVIAFSFGLYGLVRKLGELPASIASALEMTVLAPIALAYLLFVPQAEGFWLGLPGTGQLLLVSAGVVTIVPLLLFGAALRRVPLATMGFLQYLTPTLQFSLAVFLYGESLRPLQLASMICIWIGLACYAWSGRNERAANRLQGHRSRSS